MRAGPRPATFFSILVFAVLIVQRACHYPAAFLEQHASLSSQRSDNLGSTGGSIGSNSSGSSLSVVLFVGGQEPTSGAAHEREQQEQQQHLLASNWACWAERLGIVYYKASSPFEAASLAEQWLHEGRPVLFVSSPSLLVLQHPKHWGAERPQEHDCDVTWHTAQQEQQQQSSAGGLEAAAVTVLLQPTAAGVQFADEYFACVARAPHDGGAQATAHNQSVTPSQPPFLPCLRQRISKNLPPLAQQRTVQRPDAIPTVCRFRRNTVASWTDFSQPPHPLQHRGIYSGALALTSTTEKAGIRQELQRWNLWLAGGGGRGSRSMCGAAQGYVQKVPALALNAQHQEQQQRELALTLRVLTMNRPWSLLRLLQSLSAADYQGQRVDLEFFVDMPRTRKGGLGNHISSSSSSSAGGGGGSRGEGRNETLQLVRGFQWPHGRVSYSIPSIPRGIAEMWLRPHRPQTGGVDGGNGGRVAARRLDVEAAEDALPTLPMLLVLEDDLEVSPLFFSWLRATVVHYMQEPSSRHAPFGPPFPPNCSSNGSGNRSGNGGCRVCGFGGGRERSSCFCSPGDDNNGGSVGTNDPHSTRLVGIALAHMHEVLGLGRRFSLPGSRPAVIARAVGAATPVFLSQKSSSWGMAFFSDHWNAFVAHARAKRQHLGDTPCVPGLVSNRWYLERPSSMWTPWLHRFMFDRGMYALYFNYGSATLFGPQDAAAAGASVGEQQQGDSSSSGGGNSSSRGTVVMPVVPPALVVNHKEKGLHYARKYAATSDVVTADLLAATRIGTVSNLTNHLPPLSRLPVYDFFLRPTCDRGALAERWRTVSGIGDHCRYAW